MLAGYNRAYQYTQPPSSCEDSLCRTTKGRRPLNLNSIEGDVDEVGASLCFLAHLAYSNVLASSYSRVTTNYIGQAFLLAKMVGSILGVIVYAICVSRYEVWGDGVEHCTLSYGSIALRLEYTRRYEYECDLRLMIPKGPSRHQQRQSL